jgi:cytochrome c peroxidase
MGMSSLANVVVNDPPELLLYVRSTAPVADATTNLPTHVAPPQALTDYQAAHGLSVQRAALLILGKAFFWDQQSGSDGQACASCHFIAGTDNRTVNTLNPGSRNTDATEAVTYNPTASGGTGAVNYTLAASDFPFHQVVDPLDTN